MLKIDNLLSKIKLNQGEQFTLLRNATAEAYCSAHPACLQIAEENLALFFKFKRFKNKATTSVADFTPKYLQGRHSISPHTEIELEAQLTFEACDVVRGCHNWQC